jgi:hypothetical protein
MGKITTELADLPTVRIRGRVWARVIKRELLPTTDPYRPYGNRIGAAVCARIEQLEDGEKTEALALLPYPSSECISSGRWSEWWQGTHPQPDRKQLFSLLVPGSAEWFSQKFSSGDEHPLHTLLFAIDVWGGKCAASDKALGILVALARKWRPRETLRKSQRYIRREGWYWPPVNGTTLPADVASDHFRLLEPASVIEAMLWCGHAIHVESDGAFVNWVFDLLSASLATLTLLQEEGLSADAHGGRAADLAAFVHACLVRMPAGKPPIISCLEAGTPPDKSTLNALNAFLQARIRAMTPPGKRGIHNGGPLPADNLFLNLMSEAIQCLVLELSSFGIIARDLNDLDASIWWLKRE